MNRLLVLLAVIAAVAVSHAQSRNITGPAPDMSPTAPENITKLIGIDDKRKNVVPLTTEFVEADGSATGKKIILRDVIKDKPVIILPAFYTCKSTCPLMFNGVLECIRKFKELKLGVDFDIVTIGIKPSETVRDALAKRDEIIHVTELARMEHGNDGWHLLTGSQENIKKVTDALGYRYNYDAQKDIVQHPAGIIIVTPDGIVSRYFYGMEYVPKLVSNALKDAKANRVGPEAPKVFFGCLEYNAMTGTYSLVISNVLKVLGISTLLILVGSIAFMGHKYREKNSDLRADINRKIGQEGNGTSL